MVNQTRLKQGSTITWRLAQLSAMTYYEMRMLWRRRMPRVLVLSVIMTVGVALLAYRALANTELPVAVMSNVLLLHLTHNAMIGYVTWPLVYVLVLIMGGLMVADVVPGDPQLGVNLVLDSTPLTRATYLLGKLCGAWATLLLSLTIALVVVGALSWVIVGPYDLEVYVRMWFGGLAPLGLLHVGVCLLLTAPLASRRKAIMLSLIYGVGCVLLLQAASTVAGVTLWGILNPARPYVLYYYWLGWLRDLSFISTPIGYAEARWSLVLGLVELGGLGLLVWMWLRARERRL